MQKLQCGCSDGIFETDTSCRWFVVLLVRLRLASKYSCCREYPEVSHLSMRLLLHKVDSSRCEPGSVLCEWSICGRLGGGGGIGD